MKRHSVQRGVQLATHVRKIGQAPDLGRMGRISESYGDGQFVDRDRDRRKQQRRVIVIGWSIALGCLTFAIVGFAFVSWIRPILGRAKDTTERDRVVKEGRVRKVSKFPSPSKEEALALVRQALAVREPAAVERLIRPGSVTCQDVVAYLTDLEVKDGVISDYTWLSNVDKNGLLLEGVQVVFQQPERKRSRLAFLTPDDKGDWKMDFEAFARTVKPSWDGLLEQTPEAGMMRVYAGRDRYYNGPYADESVWAVYGMGSEDLEFSLYGYCRRGSLQHQAMELMVSMDDKALVRATLEIRKIAGAERRQFEITRVLAEDWVVAEEAFETTVK